MKLHHLRSAPGATRRRRRVGRGRAAGQGKTAGRGTKGYGARHNPKLGFEGGEVDPAAMLARGLIHGGRPVKVLARGDIGRALTVKAQAFSEAAKAKIEAAGGRTEIVI